MFQFGHDCIQILVSYLPAKDVIKISQLYAVNLQQYLRTHPQCAFGNKSNIYTSFKKKCEDTGQYLIVRTGYTSRLLRGQKWMSLFNEEKIKRCNRLDTSYDSSFFHGKCNWGESIDVLKHALAIQDQLIYLRNDVKRHNHVKHEDIIKLCKLYPDSIIFDLQHIKQLHLEIADLLTDMRSCNYCLWYNVDFPIHFELDGGVRGLVIEVDTESG